MPDADAGGIDLDADAQLCLLVSLCYRRLENIKKCSQMINYENGLLLFSFSFVYESTELYVLLNALVRISCPETLLMM
jgi:hypothetical protein